MKILRHLFVAILFILVSSVCKGSPTDASKQEEYRFVHITSASHNLSYDGVKCVLQDSRGFLWIGTHNGLNRYDGNRVRVWMKADMGIGSDYINALEEDSGGNIWIGTNRGLTVYDYGKDAFISMSDYGCDTLEVIKVYDMARDSRGGILIGSNAGGLYRFDVETGSFRLYGADAGFRGSKIYRIVAGEDGTVFMAMYCDDIRCFSLEDGKLRSLCPDGMFRNDDVSGIALSSVSDGKLYVASKRNGLCEVDVEDGTVRRLAGLSDEQRPVNLTASSDGSLWLCTTSGLLHHDLLTGRTVSLRHDTSDVLSLSDDYVSYVTEDKSGGLYVGTHYGGVNRHTGFQNIFGKHCRTSDGESLKGCRTSCFAQDRRGKVWVGTERAGLLEYDSQTERLSRTGYPLPETVTSLCADGRRLWIGSLKGLHCLDIETGNLRSYLESSDNSSDNRIISSIRLKNGEVLVAAAPGVMRYDSRTDTFVPLTDMDNVAVEAMAEDKDGTLWLASYSNGLYAYDPKEERMTGHWLPGADCPVPEMTSSVIAGSGDDIWISSFSAGFCRYDRKAGTFTAYDRTDLPSMPSEMIMSVLEDGCGRLWMSSGKGLLCFSKDSSELHTFRAEDGLLNDEFKKAAILLGDGTMLYGSADGFISFCPDSVRFGEFPSEVRITDLLSGGRSIICETKSSPADVNIDFAESVVLKARQNSFDIHLAVPESDFPAGKSVRCRLDGYDEEWRDVSSSMAASYTDVPPGRYRFLILTKDGNGRSIEAHSPLAVIVRPPFYRSWAGLLLFVILVAGAAAYISFSLMTRKRRREEEERREKEAKKLPENVQLVDMSRFNIGDKDEDFLRNLDRIVMAHIDDTDFSVRQLEDELLMTHSSLNRKMNALLNMSPNEYIRTKRLAMAAQLLTQKDVRISEVCYAAGFSSSSYFAKCFKAAYGKSPAEYARDAMV